MSVQTALANIRLESCDRWGHTEYSVGYHKEFVEGLTDMDPGDEGFARALHEKLQMDLCWSTNDGLVNWAESGRVTDMGHAVYAADGSDERQPVESPFRTAEEVWAFDAVAEYGLGDFDEQVAAYEAIVQRNRARLPDQLVTGGYYKTIVSGAIQAFGWEMLLLAAADRDKMEKVLDGFFRRTLFHMQAWAQTSVEAVIQHDDFVWTQGAFLHPDFYREIIIPRYAKLWEPIRAAGKKLLFCSDGNFMEFAEDVVAAGADGLIFEPCNDFGWMVDRFGSTTCLVGSFVDCRDLTFGRWDVACDCIDRTFERLADCRGAIVATGNHLPANIPDDMMHKYFDTLLPRLQKG